MAFTAEIFNYKTIKHETITVEGYTLLVGKNFIGKSAAIHAIAAALQNAEGDGFIRHGEKFCEVRLTFKDSVVIWHKEKGNNFYAIEYKGKLYDIKKAGRGDIPQPLKDMGFAPLQVSNEKVYLWYAPQFEPLFLINRPRQGFSTDIIASVTKMDAIYKASDLAKKELGRQNSNLKTRQVDLRDAQDKLTLYAPLENYFALEQNVKDIQSSTTALGKEIKNIESISKEYEEGLSVAQNLVPVDNLAELPLLPLEKTKRDVDKVITLLNEYDAAVTEFNTSNIVKDLQGSPKEAIETVQGLIQEINRLDDLTQEFTVAVNKLEEYKVVEGTTDVMQELPAIEKGIASLNSVVVLDKEYQSAHSDFMTTKGFLDNLGTAVSVQDISELLMTVNTLSMLENTYKESSHLYAEGDDELKDILGQIEINDKELSEFKECPLCRRTL